MITNKELNAVKLSPTKKDFYQIWNELLDTAGKISERWDPTSTNESDPGIVLLKVLTAVADKLNYNIDANTLEAFMPSAAQEESMRKLTEMLGYNMHYYRSATTEVKIAYNKNTGDTQLPNFLYIDKFTNIKDIDDSINYVTLEPVNLTSATPSNNVMCMEGEIVECETDDNNIVSLFHLDDNKRYFLPETQVAENGIFVTNIENNIEGESWTQVSNLNAQSLGSKIFKFGFDSQEGLPYIQFPEDISTIIEDGLRIKYIRTNGANGNISVNTLSRLTTPLSWTSVAASEKKAYHDVANYTVSNIRAATNGANKEGLNAAYNNFKKTVGTFDTLVTCRDYMNKIYQLVSAVDNTTPLVSNVIVSDIKDDINRAVTLGTFTRRGIEYKAIAKPGKTLTHFDLMLYPFKSIYGLNSKTEFTKSFTYDDSNVPEILASIEDNKVLAHNIVSPEDEELACIKNCYRLRAKINTIRKVGTVEQASILANVYSKLFENFNMRQLDFGEEIPYDTLLHVIENADPRIKNISLEDPELSTVFSTVRQGDKKLTDSASNTYYNSLVLNNVLAGRVPLFNYNTNFKTDYTEKAYSGTDWEGNNYEPQYPAESEKKIYKLKTDLEIPVSAVAGDNILSLTENEVVQFRAPSFKTKLTYPAYVNYYLILDKSGTEVVKAIPATMQTLREFLFGGPGALPAIKEGAIEHYINDTNFPSDLIVALQIDEDSRGDQNKFKNKFNEIISNCCAVFTKSGEGKYEYVATADTAWSLISSTPDTTFYALTFNRDVATGDGTTIWNAWDAWVKSLTLVYIDSKDKEFNTVGPTTTLSNDTLRIKGLYKINGAATPGNVGELTDSEGHIFKLVESPKTIATNPFNSYYLPRIWTSTEIPTDANLTNVEAKDWHTQNSLGQSSQPVKITAGTEYELKQNEYLLINYTKSKNETSDEKVEICDVHRPGEIIKPNFDLVDSEDWAAAHHSYTKFLTKQPEEFNGISTTTAMFTLGTNEQIEIRDIIRVELADSHTNLYWDIPNLVSTSGGYIEFPWDEEPIHPTTGARITNITKSMTKGTDYIFSAYTLKEGEYLYYTDMNKSDIAFYGFGSTVRRGINTPPIFKYTSDDLISAEQISSAGLSASIPWRNCKLNDENAAITITENQFINLTEGDQLISLNFSAGSSTGCLDSQYRDVTDATYAFATADATDAERNKVTEHLPVLSLNNANYKWQVRSKLNLAISPTKAQTLRTRDINGSTTEKVKDKISLITTTFTDGVKDEVIVALTAENKDKPLSIKTNKIVQSAAVVTDVTTKKMAEDGNLEDLVADLQIKLFESQTVQNNLKQIINIGNYGEGNFTTLNFEEQFNQVPSTTEESVTFPLYVNLPSNTFGLIMVYYQNLNTATDASSALITSTKDRAIEFFNRRTSWSWEDTDKKILKLNPGINIIKINESDTLTISSNTNNKAIVTFSNLDLVDLTDSLNPKLCYRQITESTSYGQALKDIQEVDEQEQFYYNIPIAGNIDIDMNPYDDTDTLENPLNWFNYNNINNKFVISVIDTEHLVDDIVIARSSRSNF